MSQSASQAHAFYAGVASTGKVWTLRDAGGFPAPITRSGKRAQPFWSSLSRVQKIIKSVPAYTGFEPVEVPWVTFRDRWLPGLERDGLLVGVNWSGKTAMGYDVEAERVRQAIERQIEMLEAGQ